jgi:Zn-dependent protease
MDYSDHTVSGAAAAPSPSAPPKGSGFKKILAPLGFGLLLFGKLFAKFKLLLFPLFKFAVPIFKTGGTMILSIGAYAMLWGWKYAVGFVLLILVHECGHLVAARRMGLDVGWPVFIPFMGAVIALKEAPRNAWIEAVVGIGGPLLGTVGAIACMGLFQLTGHPIFQALAYTGFLLNLFNLTPIGFLDGGRIVTALSPWLWVVGFLAMLGMVIARPGILLILILAMSIPRLFSLFRRKSDEERRYFEVTPGQRVQMGFMYFGLVILLVWAMSATHVAV